MKNDSILIRVTFRSSHTFAEIFCSLKLTLVLIDLFDLSLHFRCVCVLLFAVAAIMNQVAWIHIDRQMILTIHRHVISKIPRYSITYDNANTWQLHVNQAQQDDRGYYMCQVSKLHLVWQNREKESENGANVCVTHALTLTTILSIV